MTMTKLTTKKLNAAVRFARKHNEINREINRLFEKRYGVSYSDIDEDWLIDSLDYGTGAFVSLKQCDELMTKNGHPPLPPDGHPPLPPEND